MNEEFARATRFGGRVVHGMLTLSVTGGLRYPLNGDRLVCLYGIERIRMVRPVRIGDSVRVEGEVASLVPKDAGGVVTFADGFRYEGNWRNGEPHGDGVLTFADGSTMSLGDSDGVAEDLHTGDR